jgi:hypothetical protein
MSDTIGGSNFGTSNTIGGSNFGGGLGGFGAPAGTTPAPAVPTHFAVTIGDGVTTVFPITHGLGTQDTTESVYLMSTLLELADPAAYTVTHTSPMVTTFTFAAAPALNNARVTIHV